MCCAFDFVVVCGVVIFGALFACKKNICSLWCTSEELTGRRKQKATRRVEDRKRE